MYGAVNYTLIDEVRKLRLKVSGIYRQLTTWPWPVQYAALLHPTPCDLCVSV
jgi:hypothetical protein